ncbi:response regulator transcription factor [Malaciobacter marinus]|uniref:DNA-binding response regulator n=1 Tax=Malaciobacter marinus TaxID=505249 RepID=A0A347TGZ5_9BACT|nr:MULTISPECIES: response regulator transcription factor [Malaciobacter]AXX85873.1 two-component system response regulator [Malaciobacter marinus]PHO12817.1 DNA-binding response regulator [Malaciobacter marinus]PHO15003.1 DNA-binding response regulator [Malaciobacter marinus]RYA24327.1 DNA-binding response regulator [Malaciobacter halophilus]
MNILLLEDNKKLNQIISKRLKLKGYKVDSYVDGNEAYNNITEGFSCFILDINVPNIDGIKILKKIREFYDEVPVIIISASIELEVIKESYNFGCSDYLKKPFFIDELEIKVERLCKIKNDLIYFDESCYFDYKSSVVYLENQPQRLTKKERLLLNLFLTKRNQVLSYDTIQNYVWEGSFASLESIRSLIRRLRKVLSNKYIETVVDTGYIFKTT